jgi:hypothetical protein
VILCGPLISIVDGREGQNGSEAGAMSYRANGKKKSVCCARHDGVGMRGCDFGWGRRLGYFSAGQVEAVRQVGPAGIGEGVEGGEADAGHQLGVLFGVGLFRDRRMVRPSYDDNRCFYIVEVVGNPTTKE